MSRRLAGSLNTDVPAQKTGAKTRGGNRHHGASVMKVFLPCWLAALVCPL